MLPNLYAWMQEYHRNRWEQMRRAAPHFCFALATLSKRDLDCATEVFHNRLCEIPQQKLNALLVANKKCGLHTPLIGDFDHMVTQLIA